MKKEEFDAVIKRNLVDAGCGSFGYVLAKTYENYYTKQAFAQFLAEMRQPRYQGAFHAYDAGKGSELKEQNGRYGRMPPKMASVASSSRFCYLALRDGAGALGGSGSVKFEHACRIDGISGIAPQLDAYVPNENIYVEAKCHEIFDMHHVVMKAKYWDLIYGKDNCFGFDVLEKPEAETFEIPCSAFGVEKPGTMFDIKQFLCHLLGIASQKRGDEPAKLAYLFFKPRVKSADERAQIDEVFDKLQQEIAAIFASVPIRTFAAGHNIRLMAVAEISEAMGPLESGNMIVLEST